MELVLELQNDSGGFHFRVTSPRGLTFSVDAHSQTPAGPSPMQMLLASVPACATMDIVSILRKQRVEISSFRATVRAQRAEEHPRVFTAMHLHFVLSSPNATEQQLRRAIELSEEKYCSAWATLRASGCAITWTDELQRPPTHQITG